MKKHRILIIVLSTLVASVIIMFVNERWVKDEVIKNILSALAISGITTGVFSFLLDRIQKDSIEDRITESFKIYNKTNHYGIAEIGLDNFMSVGEYRDGFLDSKSVTVIMNDGKSFYEKNAKIIAGRLLAPGKTTNFVFHDYTQKDLLSVWSRKYGHSGEGDYYVNKINNVIRHIKSNGKHEKHILNFYFNSNYNSMRIVLTDGFAWVCPYRESANYQFELSFLVKREGEEYRHISQDANRLLSENFTRKLGDDELTQILAA